MKRTALLALVSATCFGLGSAWAKLPAPDDAAKARAAEAAARAAHGNKVANFQLCRSMDRVALHYREGMKKAGKDVKPATATDACVDPGPYVAAAPTK